MNESVLPEELLEHGILYFKASKYDDALIYWNKAAEKGNPGAMFCLGLLSMTKGIRNVENARKWFEKAEKHGHKNARKMIELISINGDKFDYIDDYFGIQAKNTFSIFPTFMFGGTEWLVLKEQGRKILCLAKNIIDIRPFDFHKMNTWEKSSIRSWLNTDFIDSFSHSERELLVKSKLHNEGNPLYGTPGGNDTEDYIFLLSLSEIVNAFRLKLEMNQDESLISTESWNDNLVAYVNMSEKNINNASKRVGVDYSLAQGQSLGWWLRTPGSAPDRVMRINCHGVIRMHGRETDRSLVGVRPAFWMEKKL